MRLSQYIAKNYNISRREAKEEILNGKVFVNLKICKKDIDIQDVDNIEYKNNSINLNDNNNDNNITNSNNDNDSSITICNLDHTFEKYILYKDSDYLFLYKPYFMHSDRHRQSDPLTISDIINHYKSYISLTRLDYETDGIIGAISQDLYSKINNLKISKKYLAITYGIFPKKIEISNKINAAKTKKVKVIDNDNSGFKTTITLIESKTIKYLDKEINISLVEVYLDKAARHQVRAYTSYLKHPIIFDELYGDINNDKILQEYINHTNKNNIIPKRLMLHCFNYNIENKNIFCNDETLIFKNYFHNL